MAIIMKIRNRFGAVIIGVIALAIVSFLLMDALNSNSNLLGGGNTDVLAEVEGKQIKVQTFEARYQENLSNYQTQTQQATIEEATTLSIREQTWNQMLNEQLMGNSYENLGITVTSDELLDMIQGNNPHPQVVQAFSNPESKKFDPNQVVVFLQNLDNDETGDTRKRWLIFEKYLKEDRLKTKYNNLVKKSLYVPRWLAKRDYANKNSFVDFDFVFLPYFEINDDEVKLTDTDYKKYIDANKNNYGLEESRTVEYISFPIVASPEDTANALGYIENQIQSFAETENDSVYIKLYSDQSFDEKYYSLENLKSSIKDTFFTIDPKTIVGPYFEDGNYIAAKLLDRKKIADSVSAKQILLVPTKQEEVEVMRTLSDSIKTAVEAGADFAVLAAQYSKDNTTASKGGDWGTILPGEKSININNDLFYKHQQGDVFVSTSNEGFHVIQITKANPTNLSVKVAFLTKQIVPSQQTERALFKKAGEFAATNNTLEKFRNSDQKDKIQKSPRILRNDYNVFGLGISRDLVRWAFEAEVGNISNVLAYDDKYVVAAVVTKSEKGVVKVDDLKEEIKGAVLKEKKAELLIEKINAIKATSLNEIADKLGKPIQSATGINFSNNFLPNTGAEPKVSNYAFSLAENTTSKPLQGENGVFVLSLKNKIPANEITDYSISKQQIKTGLEQRVEGQIFEALKKSSNIKDQRHLFY